MQKSDPDVADLQVIAAVVLDEVAPGDSRHPCDASGLLPVDVDGDGSSLEELGQARDLVAEELSPDVVLVVVVTLNSP